MWQTQFLKKSTNTLKNTYFYYDTNCNIAPNTRNIKSLQQVIEWEDTFKEVPCVPTCQIMKLTFISIFWYIHNKVNIASDSNISKGQHEWPYLVSKPHPMHSKYKAPQTTTTTTKHSIKARIGSPCLWMLHHVPPPLANKPHVPKCNVVGVHFTAGRRITRKWVIKTNGGEF